MHLAIITVLIALNGLFALAEIAVVSCRKSRLEEAAEQGNRRAATVRGLLDNPERFLSAIQVGITLVGIVSGAYSGVALTEDLRPYIAAIGPLAPYAAEIAMVLLVVTITFCTIVFGELIPKTIALANPEPIAFFLAPLIAAFTKLAYPAVILLSTATKLVVRALHLREGAEQPLSERELLAMIKTAGRQGALGMEELQLHENLLLLSDKRALHIMTIRTDVDMIDIAWPPADIEAAVRKSMHSFFPVYEESLDNIIGVLQAKDFFAGLCRPGFDPRAVLSRPVFFPENLTPLQIVKIFRQAKNYFGIVVNEHGAFEGVLTLHDLIEHVFGDMPFAGEAESHRIVTMADGALLADGGTPLFKIVEALHLNLPEENLEKYATVAGLVYDRLKNIPAEGACIALGDFLLEVVDMEGPKIDKIMIRKKPAAPPGAAPDDGAHGTPG